MDYDRIGVVGVWRHRVFMPSPAVVLGRHHTDESIRNQNAVRASLVDENAMDVVFTHLRVDVEILEGLPEIGGRKECPDLYAHHQPIAVDHDVLDMAYPRRRRETPAFNARHFA